MLDSRPNFHHPARGLVSQHHWIFDHKVCNSAMLPIVNIWSTDPNGVHLDQNIFKNRWIWKWTWRWEVRMCSVIFWNVLNLCINLIMNFILPLGPGSGMGRCTCTDINKKNKAKWYQLKFKKRTKQIKFLFSLLPAGGLLESTAQRKDFLLPWRMCQGEISPAARKRTWVRLRFLVAKTKALIG